MLADGTEREEGPTGNRADRPEMHGCQVGGAVPQATARLEDCGVRRRRSTLARGTETGVLVVMLPPTFALVAAVAPTVPSYSVFSKYSGTDLWCHIATK